MSIAKRTLIALLDRSGSKIPPDDLRHLVMNDPGGPEYVAAYTRIIDDPALLLSPDEEQFLLSFDVTESLRLAHRNAALSVVHRWFSVFASCLELLGAGVSRDIPRSLSLGTLLEDIFVLGSASDIALAHTVCREFAHDDDVVADQLAAVLGILMTADLTANETDELCDRLLEMDIRSRSWGPAGRRGFASDRFLIGVIAADDRQSARTWTRLILEHFPRTTAAARDVVDAATSPTE